MIKFRHHIFFCSVSRPLSESGSQLSDFDAALMRARASVSDDKSIVLSGSPPRKVNFTQVSFFTFFYWTWFFFFNIKVIELLLNKVINSIDFFFQPGFSESSPSSSYRSRNIPDEEMILNLALKDLISILGLKVCFKPISK